MYWPVLPAAWVGLEEQRVVVVGTDCSFGSGTGLAVVEVVDYLGEDCFVVGCLRQCSGEYLQEYLVAFLVVASRVVDELLLQKRLQNHVLR